MSSKGTFLIIGLFLIFSYFAFSPWVPPCPKVGKKIACFAESKYSDGSRYLGEWSDDKRHGKGTLSYPNGSLYSGDWSNGKMTGNGEFLFPSGNKYIGQFVNGRFHGWGRLKKVNGNMQEGNWKNGRFHFRFVFPS